MRGGVYLTMLLLFLAGVFSLALKEFSYVEVPITIIELNGGNQVESDTVTNCSDSEFMIQPGSPNDNFSDRGKDIAWQINDRYSHDGVIEAWQFDEKDYDITLFVNGKKRGHKSITFVSCPNKVVIEYPDVITKGDRVVFTDMTIDRKETTWYVDGKHRRTVNGSPRMEYPFNSSRDYQISVQVIRMDGDTLEDTFTVSARPKRVVPKVVENRPQNVVPIVEEPVEVASEPVIPKDIGISEYQKEFGFLDELSVGYERTEKTMWMQEKPEEGCFKWDNSPEIFNIKVKQNCCLRKIFLHFDQPGGVSQVKVDISIRNTDFGTNTTRKDTERLTYSGAFLPSLRIDEACLVAGQEYKLMINPNSDGLRLAKVFMDPQCVEMGFSEYLELIGGKRESYAFGFEVTHE